MLCCSARTRRSRYGRLPFLSRRKNGRYAREAQALRRTDAGISCVVVGRNTTAGMPPSSALSLPVSAAPARQLSRANRPCKRKSTAAELLFCAFAAFANLQHKTDGSYVNRPFFRSKRDVRENAFPQIIILSRSVFCFFSSRKENVPFRRKEIVPLLRNRPPFQASCVMPFALHLEAPSATIEEIKPTEVIPCIACIAEPS